jgi:hypothetical protein
LDLSRVTVRRRKPLRRRPTIGPMEQEEKEGSKNVDKK